MVEQPRTPAAVVIAPRQRPWGRVLLVVTGVVLLLVAGVLSLFVPGRARPDPSDTRIRLALLETVPAAFAYAPWYGSLEKTDKRSGGYLEIDARDSVVIVRTSLPASDAATATMVCHAMLAVAYDPHLPTPLIVKRVEVWGLPAEIDPSKPLHPREKIADCRP